MPLGCLILLLVFGSSLVTCPEDKRVLEDDDLEDDIIFGIEANLKADDMAVPTPRIPRRSTYQSRYLPGQVRAEACTEEIDEAIRDTHLQHGLRIHPSAKARRA